MDIVILDLEWNGTYSRRLKGYINEIIEFGAVKCGPDLSEKATFSCFVKPQVAKHISSTISTLTSITDETLTGGGHLYAGGQPVQALGWGLCGDDLGHFGYFNPY